MLAYMHNIHNSTHSDHHTKNQNSIISIGNCERLFYFFLLGSFLIFEVTLPNGTSVPFMGRGQMIGIGGIQDALCLETPPGFQKTIKKIKKITSGHSTSIVPSRDSESRRLHLIFD